jgi:hypothetical protein
MPVASCPFFSSQPERLTCAFGAFGIALNLSLLVKMVTREAHQQCSAPWRAETYAHIESWRALARQIAQGRGV